MAEFYDHESGKLYFRAPAGGGNSVWDAPATHADIAGNPAAHREYLQAKQAAKVAEAEAASVEAIKAENSALHGRIADLAKEAEAPLGGDKPAA